MLWPAEARAQTLSYNLVGCTTDRQWQARATFLQCTLSKHCSALQAGIQGVALD